MQLQAVRRDGTEIPVELSIVALSTEDGLTFNAFLRDISDRVAAEAELQDAETVSRAPFATPQSGSRSSPTTGAF